MSDLTLDKYIDEMIQRVRDQDKFHKDKKVNEQMLKIDLKRIYFRLRSAISAFEDSARGDKRGC